MMEKFKNKKTIFLYLTGFFSGMSVMAIELGASRLLSPFFSSSQIVWTIIIGTIMIAMALGNIIGGRIADKEKNPTKLFILLFIVSIWTALIPLVGKMIIGGIAVGLATFITHNYLIWAALLSCLIVFVFPLLVLGMVTPNLVKYACSTLDESGKVVGRIEALNTIGSIIGTFVPTFITIPNIGTTWTFLVFAIILFIITLTYFIFFSIKWIRKVVIVVIVLGLGIASSFIPTAFWQNNVLYEGESIYNYLRVAEEDDYIYLSTNVLFGIQSMKMKNGELTDSYYDTALAANTFVDSTKFAKDILILGLGTGTYAEESLKYFKVNKIEGVEIDQKIIDLAYKYFDLDERVITYTEDGRAFINRSKDKYDVIMVDAYQDISIPFSMSSLEFFTLIKEHLNHNGCLVVNMNMYSDKEGSINDYLSSTIKHVFPYVYTSKIGTNVELFASVDKDFKEGLNDKIPDIESDILRERMEKVYKSLNEYTNTAYLLTDDKAAVEKLSMSVLDDMIVDELSGFKNMIKGKSIKELIKMLFNGDFA